MSDKIAQTTRHFFLNDTSFLQKQALVLKKRPITQQKPPKTTIFKAAENRIILNNFFFSSKYRVKWRGTKRKLILKTNQALV